jgi:polyhydroxybutyrate depolymerase
MSRCLSRIVPVVLSVVALLAVAPAAALAVAAPLASTASGAYAPSDAAAGTDTTITLPSGRSYVLFTPSRRASHPGVVVALHWFSGNAAQMEAHSDLDLGAAATGSYVAYPESGVGAWNAGTCCGTAAADRTDDVGFLDQVLTDAEARGRVAEGRVLMTGFSNGGFMTYAYACAHPTRLAMIVPVAATDVSGCSSAVSTLAVHGALDTSVPWAGLANPPAPLGGSFPSVPSVVGGQAWANGCTGGFSQSASPGRTTFNALGCPPGKTVMLFLITAMGHWWPVGAADQALYGGADATQLVWSAAMGTWG